MNDKSKGQPKQSNGVQLKETFNNVSAYADALDCNESQSERNDLASFTVKSNNSIAPPPDTDFEEGHDVFIPTDIPNNMQVSDGPKVSSRGRTQIMSRKLRDSIESSFRHDLIAFQSTF